VQPPKKEEEEIIIIKEDEKEKEKEKEKENLNKTDYINNINTNKHANDNIKHVDEKNVSNRFLKCLLCCCPMN
jgi:hypothetical protein